MHLFLLIYNLIHNEAARGLNYLNSAQRTANTFLNVGPSKILIYLSIKKEAGVNS